MRIERGEPGSQRTRHSLLVVGVDHDLETSKQGGRELAADGFRGSAENQDDLIDGSAANVLDRLAEHGALAQAEQLFCFPHARGLACGQDDGRHSRGFPVELVGVGELHAAFLTESRTREPVWSLAQEIRVAHWLLHSSKALNSLL